MSGNRQFIVGLVFLWILILPAVPPGRAQERASETLSAAVDRAAAAQGNGWGRGTITGSIAEGTVTLFTTDGPGPTFGVTVLRKGENQVQTIIHQPGADVRVGTDGVRHWHSLSNGMRTDARGQAMHRIEIETVRSPAALADHRARGLELRDKGRGQNARIVEAEGPEGRKTDYHIDDQTALVSRVEFVTGEKTDMFGNPIPSTEVWLYSDYRDVDGVPTPFRIERRIDGMKVEEIVLESVRYNADIDDNQFRP
jgi:hypothetical protein